MESRIPAAGPRQPEEGGQVKAKRHVHTECHKQHVEEDAAPKLARSRELNLAAQARYRRKLSVRELNAAQGYHSCNVFVCALARHRSMPTPWQELLQWYFEVSDGMGTVLAQCDYVCSGLAAGPRRFASSLPLFASCSCLGNCAFSHKAWRGFL